MRTAIPMIAGCRIVRQWVAMPWWWLMAEPVAVVIQFLSLLAVLLGLLSLWGTLSAAWNDEAPPDGGSLSAKLIAIGGAVAILIGVGLVRGRLRMARTRRAEACGPEAAYATASTIEPVLEGDPSQEGYGRWIRAFRERSDDVCLINRSCAWAIGNLADQPDQDHVLLVGTSRRTAMIGAVALWAAIVLAIWLTSDSWIELAVGLATDCAGVLLVLTRLARTRRLGGSLEVRRGRILHGTVEWSGCDSLLTIRRFNLGLIAYYRVLVIGASGLSELTLRDRTEVRRALRQAIFLWGSATHH